MWLNTLIPIGDSIILWSSLISPLVKSSLNVPFFLCCCIFLGGVFNQSFSMTSSSLSSLLLSIMDFKFWRNFFPSFFFFWLFLHFFFWQRFFSSEFKNKKLFSCNTKTTIMCYHSIHSSPHSYTYFNMKTVGSFSEELYLRPKIWDSVFIL